MKQLEVAASELPQAFAPVAMAKSEEFVPVRLMTMPVSRWLPELARVTVAAPVVPTA